MTHIKDINLKFDKKEITTILGRFCSGKSTLLRINQFIRETSKGKIFLINEEIIRTNLIFVLKIGMVFQQFI
ncbi:MAG: ATP-binding cassette domain-containing protein [Rickettsia sp.]|nr:ATP-binding cassette domain-containing protein [Rickettsia sp.]